MISFSSIEEYILVFGKTSGVNLVIQTMPSPVQTASGSLFPKPKYYYPTIKFDEFDEKFIESVSYQLSCNMLPVTDKQANYIDRLFVKYEKAIIAAGIEIPTHRHYAKGIRTINRKAGVEIENNLIYFRFPFNENIIAEIKQFAKTSHGAVKWESEAKAWQFALTEYNLSWVVAVAQSINVPLSEEIQHLFNKILELEQIPYKIELQYNSESNSFYITNAADSLNEYIESVVGFTDVYRLVDMSGALDYSVSDEILSLVASEESQLFVDMCTSQSLFLPRDYSLNDVFDWADLVGRYPILVYSPNLVKSQLQQIRDRFAEDEIQLVKSCSQTEEFCPSAGVKVIFSTTPIPAWNTRLPLIISYVNLMYGSAKRNMISMAEKVVYCCPQLPKF